MLKDLFGTNQAAFPYDKEITDILRLIRSENVGPKTFFNLIKLFGSAAIAIENIQEFSLRGGRTKPITVFSQDDTNRELDLLHKNNAKLVTYNSKEYSSLLLEIPDPPPILSYKGNIALLNQRKSIAIVGARNSSANGRMFAAKIAEELIDNDFILVSGLARGIDSTIHQVNTSKTIGVVAGGIDNIYPLENAKLFEELEHNGLIIAELPFGTKPLGQHFPQRNRIISGISLGTFVIEASIKSGSLITAKFALEQNREIFAVPGFPLDPRCQGTNKLIKQGAHMVESVEDILTNLPQYEELLRTISTKSKISSTSAEFKAMNVNQITEKMRSELTSFLSSVPLDIDLLEQYTGLPIPIIYTILLELELAGRLERHACNKVALIYA